ncbi:developmental pluripotency-associated protein 4-like [Pipistrellus kuhlii]|uniref:developmental pluripotency-associated protein 4-like n=1 Tax=Pipistrellus kuhlii TaxID=59472 RepID=UPI00174F3DF8|nr:developmental pluripotency-associated protein 4-like [Pipistrellus kuhlii]
MENTKGKKKSPKKSGEQQTASKSPPEPTKEKHRAAGEPSQQRTSEMETKRKRSKKDDQDYCPEKMEPEKKRVKTHRKIPIPPLPDHLPPVNLVHRDVVRAWCQQLKLSTSGQKWETYDRLREYAYPHQKKTPVKPEEAKILSLAQRKLKVQQGEMTLDSFALPELTASPKGGAASDGDAAALLEGMDNLFVSTSTPDDVFASWSRIAATTGKTGSLKTKRLPQEATGLQWCVVHGQSLPADTEGWVQLQFYAGQAWVPEKPGQVCALFLIPSLSFPPPHLEDNMLCPKCVHRNKVLSRSFPCEGRDYGYDCN